MPKVWDRREVKLGDIMNIGERNKLEEIKKKDEQQLKKELREECLAVAFVMISEGKTRQADEAIRVYKRLEDEPTTKSKC